MAELAGDVPLRVDRRAGADGPFLEVAGELDMSNVEVLGAAVEGFLSERPDRLILDMSGLSFMDTTGLAFLLRTNGAIGPIKLVRPSEIVRRIIETTGLGGVLVMEP